MTLVPAAMEITILAPRSSGLEAVRQILRLFVECCLHFQNEDRSTCSTTDERGQRRAPRPWRGPPPIYIEVDFYLKPRGDQLYSQIHTKQCRKCFFVGVRLVRRLRLCSHIELARFSSVG